MTPALCIRLTVDPVLAYLAGLGVKSDDRARVMLLAIGGQESGAFKARRQGGNGPARGWWQFEGGPMSATAEVLTGGATKRLAERVCADLQVSTDRATVYAALEHNDLLACAFARLLLWGSPKALPGVDQPDAGWGYYLSRWHPGKPHPETWAGHWREALEAVAANRL
ncbi:hypothetical protein [Roseomonas populi]|uniref:Lysozyme n=1 Tax=Roseomonas populi TaxID=3121582 RepID=A0ABT1X107_9PROT|nr:hypothetical protein [Roseomonas pecuniae]MCR0981778.1 hypothetical protein [Roseomonas pecuniae]